MSTETEPVVCPQCGAENPPGAKVCKTNPQCGSFLPRNTAAVIHGMSAKQLVLSPELQQHLDKFERGVASDLGGSDELTTIERGYVQKLRTVEAIVQLAVNNILKNGFTAKNEQMALQAIDRWDRLALRLGLQRRQKAISPLEAVRVAVEEANR